MNAAPKVLLRRTNVYTCDRCSRGFLHEDALKRHIQVHPFVPERNNAINKAQDTKKNEDAKTGNCIKLKDIEIPVLHTDTILNPSTCSTKLPSNLSAKKQWEGKKTLKKKTIQYMCGQCPKTYGTLAGIRSHLASHFDPSCLCSNCPESFPNQRELNRHVASNHSSKNEIRCNKCGKVLKSNRNLRVHLRTHTGVRPFPCKLCGKRFTQRASLYTHTKIHLGLKEHTCSYCNKAFTERKNMKNHERTHTKERPFECRFCCKSFGDPSALSRHVRTHTGDKRYLCRVCHKKFSDASGLIAHQKRHEPIKNFACDFCDKQFATHQMLSNHESSIHMNVKNFICDTCHKSFSLKQNLRGHIQRNHMQSMECGVCVMRFFTKTQLIRHKSMGCARDKFSCDLCGAKFSLKRFVKTHMEERHSEPLYCHICMGKFYSDSDLQKHKLKHNCAKKIHVKDGIRKND